MIETTVKEWRAKATRLYGADHAKWKFKCPVCGHVAAVQDWRDAKAPEGAIAFSCVGRWMEKKSDAFVRQQKAPCNYAGGGLLRVNPVRVLEEGSEPHDVFDFADEEKERLP